MSSKTSDAPATRQAGASSKDGAGSSKASDGGGGGGGSSKTSGGGASRAARPAQSILDRLLRFVYQQLGSALNPWFKDRMLLFNDSEEHQLEWYDAFTEFKGLIESRLEDFVHDEEGYASIGDVFDDISRSVEGEAGKKQVTRLEKLLMAAAEYEAFCEMMKKKAARYRKKQAAAKEDEAEGAVVFFEQEG